MRNKNLNIWSISQYATPPHYGYGTAHHFLAEEHVKKGHKVTIFSSSYNHYMTDGQIHNKFAKFENIDGVNFVWLKAKFYKNPHSLIRVFNWFLYILSFFFVSKKKYGRPDVVIFSSHSMLPIACAIWVKLRYNAKLIVDIRDIWPKTLILLSNKSKYHPLILLIGFCERLAYKSADFVVSTLPNLEEHVNELKLKKKIKFKCIPQGIPLNVFNSLDRLDKSFTSQYFSNGDFRIMYAGALGPSNALDTLVRVAKFFDKNQTYKKIKFYILGDGIEKERLMSLADNCSNIFFIPRIKRTQVQDFLKFGHLMYDSVQKSELYKYGLSRQKWMDYMFASRPILVSYDGFKSLINEADCGKFIEAENEQLLIDSIIEFYNLPSFELEKMGVNGKNYVLQNRTFDKLSNDYEEIFNILLYNRFNY